MTMESFESSGSKFRASLSALAMLALLIASATAWAQAPRAGALSFGSGFSPDPQVLSGVAGGPVDASVHGVSPLGPCVGWIAASPNHVVTLDEHFDYLYMGIESAVDTTMVIQGPVGYWCNDDSNALNPALFGQWAPGQYSIYIGTFQAGQSSPYTLTIATEAPNPWETDSPDGTAASPPPIGPVTLPPPSAYANPTTMPPTHTPPPTPVPPTVPPTPTVPPPTTYQVPPVTTTVPATPPSGAAGLNTTTMAPNFGSVILNAGFTPDPQSLSGTSGGAVQGQTLGNTPTGPCRGWVTPNPDHVVTLNGPLPYLRVDVSSVGDTTLIIHGPNGWWCNDDTTALNPRIAGSWVAGTYRIWVGSYTSGQWYPYAITFTSYQP